MSMRAWSVGRRIPRLLAGEQGQAATEYVLVTSLMFWGILGLAGGFPVFSKMLEAFDLYLDSIYWVLGLALT